MFEIHFYKIFSLFFIWCYFFCSNISFDKSKSRYNFLYKLCIYNRYKKIIKFVYKRYKRVIHISLKVNTLLQVKIDIYFNFVIDIYFNFVKKKNELKNLQK